MTKRRRDDGISPLMSLVVRNGVRILGFRSSVSHSSSKQTSKKRKTQGPPKKEKDLDLDTSRNFLLSLLLLLFH